MIYSFFSLDVYDKLSIRSKELLIDKKEYLKTFSLGNLPFYYNKKYKYLYTEYNDNIEVFLKTLINYIKYNDYYLNKQVMAYLYGLIINYNLDNTLNPYLTYIGTDNMYTSIKNYLDNYLVKLKEKKNPYFFKGYKYSFNIDNFDKDLTEVINFTYKEVYDIDNFSKIYLDSIKKMKRFYKVFRYDPLGIKKLFYFRNRYLSYHTKNNSEYLNLDHNKWFIDKKSNSLSFIELYLKALYNTNNMINDINQYIYYDKKIDLDKIIKKKD